jgi:hypothetical protein
MGQEYPDRMAFSCVDPGALSDTRMTANILERLFETHQELEADLHAVPVLETPDAVVDMYRAKRPKSAEDVSRLIVFSLTDWVRPFSGWVLGR